ncbi:uncharacterized protein BXZ73DRAFT_108310 [Epithele typhae]|uniref:uncharacterized protein n=1 Tax=Epithele typhae TaxID=378194 RepID=UPI002008A21E|nr:uncharacterized protein BXZ73DRAFT_108310 [Epithele typhae]KAH9910989.1 hypothetical protein BXZ73DRAFT_108310 [Epithele typhae]
MDSKTFGRAMKQSKALWVFVPPSLAQDKDDAWQAPLPSPPPPTPCSRNSLEGPLNANLMDPFFAMMPKAGVPHFMTPTAPEFAVAHPTLPMSPTFQFPSIPEVELEDECKSPTTPTHDHFFSNSEYYAHEEATRCHAPFSPGSSEFSPGADSGVSFSPLFSLSPNPSPFSKRKQYELELDEPERGRSPSRPSTPLSFSRRRSRSRPLPDRRVPSFASVASSVDMDMDDSFDSTWEFDDPAELGLNLDRSGVDPALALAPSSSPAVEWFFGAPPCTRRPSLAVGGLSSPVAEDKVTERLQQLARAMQGRAGDSVGYFDDVDMGLDLDLDAFRFGALPSKGAAYAAERADENLA